MFLKFNSNSIVINNFSNLNNCSWKAPLGGNNKVCMYVPNGPSIIQVVKRKCNKNLQEIKQYCYKKLDKQSTSIAKHLKLDKWIEELAMNEAFYHLERT